MQRKNNLLIRNRKGDMMDYELTEECYDILLEDFNEWSETYYQLFGIEGISGKDINVM